MRRALWIVLAAVIVAVAVPTAHADVITDGTINFTTISGTSPTSGFFVFDDTTDTYLTDLTVDWDGAIFDWNDLVFLIPTSGTWCAAGGSTSEFGICDDRNSTFSFDTINSTSYSGTFTDAEMANGTYTVTETVTTTTPEPGSLGLVLAGIGVLVVQRKRIARGLQQVS